MSPMSIAIPLHLLSAVIWVGGMFFAYQCLRPAAASILEPPERLKLWVGVFKLFFLWVWVAIVLILGSGYWMVFSVFGGFKGAGIHVMLMQAIGVTMMLIFMHVFFAPYGRLKRAVAQQNWSEGAQALGQIRQLVGANVLLGLLVILIGAGGRYWNL